jgi:hypothetical protein
MFNVANLSDGTQIRFLDMPAIEIKPVTAEERESHAGLMCSLREMCRDVAVPAVYGGQHVQLVMKRTTLDKINAIVKGEQ